MKNSRRINAPAIRICSWIEKELAACKNLHYRYARRQGTLEQLELPEQIGFTVKNDKKYLHAVIREDGRRVSSYLGTEDDRIVQQVQEKRFLKKALQELDGEIAALEHAKSAVRVFDAGRINESLPKAYRMSDDVLARIAGPDDEERWYAEALKAKEKEEKRLSDYFKAGRRHSAKDGTKMRSKSEVIVANALIDKGIKYIYEAPLRIKGLPVHPDFTFYSYSRGRTMIWEHAGMMGDDKYRKEFAERLSMYIEGGYTPCVDVIFSFDTSDGNVDSGTIDRLIEEFM